MKAQLRLENKEIVDFQYSYFQFVSSGLRKMIVISIGASLRKMVVILIGALFKKSHNAVP